MQHVLFSRFALFFVRLALAAGFLSAVADRFGLWGPPGAEGVAWGNWQSFVEYTALLNSYAPQSLANALAWAATVLEVVIAVGLVIGWKTKWFALAAGVLLLSFALTMTAALGIKAPLDYAVFGVSAAAFYLAASSPTPQADSDR